MTLLYENVIATPTGHLNERTFTIEIIAGGSMAEMAGMLARRPRTQVIRVDCSEELGQYKVFDRRHGIKQLPLGDRETLETLFQGVSGPLAEIVRNVAPMDARDGCGGSPAAGYRATERLIRQQDTVAYFESLISRIVAQTGARPECIHTNIHASYSGGTGAGSCILLSLFLMRLLAPLGLSVKVTHSLLGPLTYTDVSPLAGMNAAAKLGDLIAYGLDKSDESLSRMTRHIHLLELPPVGKNRRLRSQLLLLDEQAIRSAELQGHLRMIAPNQSTSGSYGNFISREAGFFPWLSVQRVVLPTVAKILSESLEQALQSISVDPTRVESGDWRPSHGSLHRLTIKAIVDRSNALTSDELLRAVQTPGTRYQFSRIWNLGQDGEFDLQRLDEYFCDAPETSTDAIHRLSLLRTCEQVVSVELADLNDRCASLVDEVAELEQEARKAHSRLNRGCWFRSSIGLTDDLIDASTNLREASDELAEAQAQMTTLRLSQQHVSAENVFLTGRFNEIREMFQQYIPRGTSRFFAGLVAVDRLDFIFPKLLHLAKRPADEQQEGLCAMAKLTTLAGLAKIVGSRQAKVDDIAEKVVYGNPLYEPVPHGTVLRRDAALFAYCFPPVEDCFRDPLKTAIEKLSPSSVIVFSDSMEVGATVIQYTFRTFDCPEQLYVGHIQYELARVRASKTKRLRFPTGEDRTPKLRDDGDAPSSSVPKT